MQFSEIHNSSIPSTLLAKKKSELYVEPAYQAHCFLFQ